MDTLLKFTVNQAPLSKQVLLVEDNPMIAKIVILHLNQLGCTVSHAPNGQTGIKMAREKNYHLIVMDIGLPDISGIDVTKQIRLDESNSHAPVPIVALTAHIDVERKEQCIEAGMQAVLSKPFTEGTMRDVLDHFIPHRNLSTTEHKPSHLSLLKTGEIIDQETILKLTGGNKNLLQDVMNILINSLATA